MENSDNNEIKILISLRPNSFENDHFQHIKKIFALENAKKQIIFTFLNTYSKEPQLLSLTKKHKINFIPETQLKTKFTYIFIFGGDGSILWTTKQTGKTNNSTIIFTFNTGHTGFINQYPLSSIQKVIKTLKTYITQKTPKTSKFPFTTLKIPKLEAKLISKTRPEKTFKVINEIILDKNDLYARWFTIYINKIKLITINCDGIIFSSQKGSTAYNASVNGPFIWPGSEGIVLSAISPFAVNFKSVVFPRDVEIFVEISDRNYGQEARLSGDSNFEERFFKGEGVGIRFGEEFILVAQEGEGEEENWVRKVRELYKW